MNEIARHEEERKVSVALIAGIVVMPYIFAWFTLKKGYSVLARGLSLGWLAACVSIIAFAPDPPIKTEASKSEPTQEVANAESDPALTAPPVAPAKPVQNRMIDQTADQNIMYFDEKLKNRLRLLAKCNIFARNLGIMQSKAQNISAKLGTLYTMENSGPDLNLEKSTVYQIKVVIQELKNRSLYNESAQKEVSQIVYQSSEDFRNRIQGAISSQDNIRSLQEMESIMQWGNDVCYSF